MTRNSVLKQITSFSIIVIEAYKWEKNSMSCAKDKSENSTTGILRKHVFSRWSSSLWVVLTTEQGIKSGKQSFETKVLNTDTDDNTHHPSSKSTAPTSCQGHISILSNVTIKHELSTNNAFSISKKEITCLPSSLPSPTVLRRMAETLETTFGFHFHL